MRHFNKEIIRKSLTKTFGVKLISKHRGAIYFDETFSITSQTVWVKPIEDKFKDEELKFRAIDFDSHNQLFEAIFDSLLNNKTPITNIATAILRNKQIDDILNDD